MEHVPSCMKERALQALKENQPAQAVAAAYNVTVRTLHNWKTLRGKNGNCARQQLVEKGARRKVSDEELLKYIEENADKYYYEMSKDLGISAGLICRRLHVLNITVVLSA
jgi:Transposase